MSFDELDQLLGGATPPAAPKKAPERPSVLIVDDDQLILKALRRVLSSRYDVTVAASALEALNAISDAHNAVILDIRMPVHDGFWACDRIREKFPDIPVIFHTAHQSDKNLETIQTEHKPFAYLFKDGDLKRLLSVVAAAVEHQRPSA